MGFIWLTQEPKHRVLQSLPLTKNLGSNITHASLKGFKRLTHNQTQGFYTNPYITHQGF